MEIKTTFVFIHSPLVGVLTWTRVAKKLRQHGYKVVLPTLSDQVGSPLPFWKQHVEAVRQTLIDLPPDQSLTLVGHSGAGPLLPVIRQSLRNPVDRYLFVDAGIPRDGASRLDLMKTESPEWAEEFHQELLQGGQFPTWSADDLREIVPDEELRRQLVAEIQPRSLPFFTEPIPVFDGWPDVPCAYVKFSAPYDQSAEQARAMGWPVREIAAGHFHMLVDPVKVADCILAMIADVQR
jgi:pimeloyl-ACP methyl ester carboxylesterase